MGTVTELLPNMRKDEMRDRCKVLITVLDA